MQKTVKMTLPLEEEPFFQNMSRTVLARIESYVYHRAYEMRQIIYFPDDPCDYVYWVREGRLRVSRVLGDGRELSFRHLTAGDMLGEECLLERPKRNDYAEAVEASVLCLMRTNDFRRIAREETELAHAVARCLSQRVLDLEQVLTESVFHTVRSRVAATLLRLCRREVQKGSITLRITHQEMANLVGATRETITGVLHDFRSEGLIEMGNRWLKIVDLGRFRQIALEN